MSPNVTNPRRKSGDHVRATIAPANLMAEPHFGVLDAVLVAVFMACVGGLIYWILG
ncbi:MAG TPA: hypothetical protein PKA41_17855 [Verrucomicrobiota bacterium]|nr:hypothetical protein [Verrucomicrobiota bacterium]